jgi:hypothetical protein
MDEYVEYTLQVEHVTFGVNVYTPAEPVAVCPFCGRIHDADGFEIEEPISYETLSYKLDRDEE